MSGYGAKTTGITENTTGAREDTLKARDQLALSSHGKGADKQAVTVGANEQEFQCVDTSKLTDLTNQAPGKRLCVQPIPQIPSRAFKAKVEAWAERIK
jgi:hypothetical protein